MIKRFNAMDTCAGHCAQMVEHHRGQWVRVEEYQKLLEAVQRLERRGWFVPNRCADAGTASDMAHLWTLLESVK